MLALAVRGPYAIVSLREALGPLDPSLARRTDPTSLRAVLGHPLVEVTRTLTAAATELVFWFGGRVDVKDPAVRAKPSAPKFRYVGAASLCFQGDSMVTRS